MELLPQLAAVLVVFALLGLTLWWLRRRGMVQVAPLMPFRLPGGARIAAKDRWLQRMDMLALSPTHSVSLVKMADRAILIGTSPAGFTLIESGSWKSLEQARREVQP